MPISGQLSQLDLITSSRANPIGAAVLANSQGWVSQAYDLSQATTAVAVTSQTIHATAVPLLANQTVNNVLLANSTAAAGTLPTTVTVGIADLTGVVRAQSTATLNTLAQQAVGINSFVLSTPYVVPSTGAYYVFFWQNGTFGTTQPTVQRSLASGLLTAGHTLYGNLGTSQSSIPANGGTALTFSASAGVYYWMGVS